MSTKSINTKVITKINIKIWDKLKDNFQKIKVNCKGRQICGEKYIYYFIFYFFSYNTS